MLVFLMSLIAMFTTPAVAPASPPAAAAATSAAPAYLSWLDGVWRTDALELTCRAGADRTTCREEGRSDAMRGAQADLTIAPAMGAAGTQLTVVLPAIPPSTFTEIARDAASVTYQTKTKVGVARLRFTRDGDTLKVERGSETAWATSMTYRRG